MLLLVLLTCSTSSFALGKFGHTLVCQLAFDHLPINQQNTINTLLKQLPIEQKQAINKYNYKDKNAAITFASSCTWADAIKRQDAFDAFKPWHYVNTTRDQQHISTDTCQSNCLTQAIIVHQQQLKNSTDLWKKVQALMFVGHWLGDIHQPLHVSFSSDLGGNKVHIAGKKEKCNNLHWLWDQCVISRTGRNKAQWLTVLNKQWKDAQVAPWQSEQVVQWADESFQIAKQKDFGYCQQVKQGDKTICQPYPKGHVALSKNYQTLYTPVMEQRLVLAAKRLHHLLMQSL